MLLLRSRRMPFIAVAGVLVVAGAGAGAAVVVSGSGTAHTVVATSAGAPAWMTSYSGYGTTMGRYGRSPGMMGGSGGMMYGGTDMGRVMGRVLAAEPGPRVSAAEAQSEAVSVPSGGLVDAAANTLTFAGYDVTLDVVAGPSDAAMYRFEIAGLVDPTVVVPVGARVTLRFVNADQDMAHGIVVVADGSDVADGYGWMPMMTEAPVFRGAEVWALGEETSSGAPVATTEFTAAVAGTYTYLCPVPGHAQQGMSGTLSVR